MRKTDSLDRQDLPRTYLAYHELKSVVVNIINIIIITIIIIVIVIVIVVIIIIIIIIIINITISQIHADALSRQPQKNVAFVQDASQSGTTAVSVFHCR